MRLTGKSDNLLNIKYLSKLTGADWPFRMPPGWMLMKLAPPNIVLIAAKTKDSLTLQRPDFPETFSSLCALMKIS